MRPTRSRRPVRSSGALVLGLALGIVAAGCGSSAGTLTAAGTTSAVGATQNAVGDTGAADGTDTGASILETDLPSAGGPIKTFAVDMQVRVINVWIPDGSDQGGAIDVWTGSAQYGKKLRTVQYGQVSEFFAPEVSDPIGQGPQSKHSAYSLSFYRAGKTTEADLLINQGEDSSPGQRLTFVVEPAEPGNKGGSVQVFGDDVGSDPAGGGWKTPDVPVPPTGQAIISMSATPMMYRGKDPRHSPAYVPSTPDGKCVNYLDSDTKKPHNDPHSFDMIGGTSSLEYPVSPGRPLRINVFDPKAQTSPDAQCATAPVVPAADPGLTAGGRAYGFLWGPDAAAPKLLLVPIR